MRPEHAAAPCVPSWLILTGEYPPQPGGVSDYARVIANALATAGESVVVFAPGYEDRVTPLGTGVVTRRLPDHFGSRSLCRLNRYLNGAGDTRRRLFVQYVPHAFGYKAMNLPFCHWLLQQSRRHEVWTLFHEVAFPLERHQSVKHNFLGVVNRVMAMLVARASSRIFVTIPAWEAMLRPMIPASRQVEWLPVPATVPTKVDSDYRVSIRRSLGVPDDALLIGHFGTYSAFIADMLLAVLPALLLPLSRHVLLLGRGSVEVAARLASHLPTTSGRVHATGGISAEAIAAHLAACDVMFQPYPDGVSSRRTSVMAGLALGVPTVTNLGHLSEPLWATTDAVELTRGKDIASFIAAMEMMLSDPARRLMRAQNGLTLYGSRFSIEHIITVLGCRSWCRAS